MKIRVIATATKVFVRNAIRSWIKKESDCGATDLRPKILKLNWRLRTDAVLAAAWSLS
jgi:hypothetical protein